MDATKTDLLRLARQISDLSDSGAAASSDGWNSAGEAWAYASTDDPTGILYATGNMIGTYSVGMRIKFTNGGSVISGIITVVGSYDAGNNRTPITFLHEIDPTDSLALVLMANSAITAAYYSTQKAPFGFPLSLSKWTVETKVIDNTAQSSPAQNTWYNMGSTIITIPIGCWNVEYECICNPYDVGAAYTDQETTLSTANNSASDTDFTCRSDFAGAGADFMHTRRKTLLLAAKTIYYLNDRTTRANIDGIRHLNSLYAISTTIRATCVYL